MRMTLCVPAALCGLVALGCAGGSTTPVAPSDTAPRIPQASLGNARTAGPNVEMPLGLYRITIDPVNVSATIEPKQVRSAAGAGEDVYDLCASDFFPSPAAKIRKISIVGSSHINVSYGIQHPFAAPTNLDGPATASNRADLGISGMCLFLIDGDSAGTNGLTSSSFFTVGSVPTGGSTLVSELVTNPHGYYTPGDQLSLSGYTCDTFPYRSLVDETDPDCRTVSATGAAIANPQGSAGNYDSVTGWQRSNIGTSNAGWTGMSVLHQGQTASGELDLDLAALDAMAAAGGSLSLDMAIIATYNDPRGGATAADKKKNRLPGATPDITKFHYDMPNGNDPVERGRVETLGFSSAAGTGDVTVHVTDYSGQLSAMASSPTGTITMCAPGVFGDSSTVVDFTSTGPVTGTGSPEDPYTQTGTVTFPPGTPPGVYELNVRVQGEFADGTPPDTLDCNLAPAVPRNNVPVREFVTLIAL